MKKAALFRHACFVLALTAMPLIALADSLPLLREAKPLFKRAAKSAMVEIGRNGIAGLNGVLQDCYERALIRQDLKDVQYCFAMHIAAIQYDMAVIKSLGGEGASEGMDLADAFDMAAPTLRRVGYKNSDEIQSVLQAWIDSFMKD